MECQKFKENYSIGIIGKTLCLHNDGTILVEIFIRHSEPEKRLMFLAEEGIELPFVEMQKFIEYAVKYFKVNKE